MKTLFFIFLSISLTMSAFASGGSKSQKADLKSLSSLTSGGKSNSIQMGGSGNKSKTGKVSDLLKESKSGGGVIVGDGTRMVTLPSGEVVPEDFILEFEDQSVTDLFEQINVEEKYPEVYLQLQKIKNLLEARTWKPYGENSQWIQSLNLNKYFIVKLVDKISCKDDSWDGCAYIAMSYNSKSFETEYLGRVIELRKSMMNDKKLSPRKKASVIFHEVLEHRFNELLNEGKNPHRLISPFVTNVNILLKVLDEQNALYDNFKQLYQITEEEYKASEKFERLLVKFNSQNIRQRGEFCISSGGGVLYASKKSKNPTVDNFCKPEDDNYLFADSSVIVATDVIEEERYVFTGNFVRKSFIDEVGTFINSKIVDSELIGSLCGKSNFMNAAVINTKADNSGIKCDGCTIKNSVLAMTVFRGIDGKSVINSKLSNVRSHNVSFLNTEFHSVDKLDLVSFYTQKSLKRTIVNAKFKNEKLKLKLGPKKMITELHISEDADDILEFDPHKVYTLRVKRTTARKFLSSEYHYHDGPVILKSVTQFENDYPQFLEQN